MSDPDAGSSLPPPFPISGPAAATILINVHSLRSNVLSPFADDCAALARGAAAPQTTTPVDGKLNATLARLLASPRLRFRYCYGGPSAAPQTVDIYLSEASNAAAVIRDGDGGFVIQPYPDFSAFLTRWSASLLTQTEATGNCLLPAAAPLSTLLAILHACDVFLVAQKTAAETEGGGAPVQFAPGDFVDSLHESRAAPQLHRLMPCLLNLVPGLNGPETGREDYDYLLREGYLAFSTASQPGSSVLEFGPATVATARSLARRAGNMVGIEIALAADEAHVAAVYHAFVAPLADTNYLVEIAPDDSGGLQANCFSGTHDGIFSRLVAVVRAAEAAAIETVSNQTMPERAVERAPPVGPICAECGAAGSPGQKFCSECGKRFGDAVKKPIAAAKESVAPLAIESKAAPAAKASSGAVSANEARGAPRSRSARDLFRRLSRPMMMELVKVEDVVAIAARLRTLRDAGAIPKEEIQRVLEKLVVTGVNETHRTGIPFTVGLGTLAWSKLVDGQWRPADEPPKFVAFMKEQFWAVCDRRGESP